MSALQTTHSGPEEDSAPEISIVVPAFDEEENIVALYNALAAVLGEVSKSWEVVFTDDGSRDSTWQRIEQLHRHDGRVLGVRLSRNFGHQYALIAGMLHARGSAVISMDSDLQHPPEVIPELVRNWRNGAMIVKTVRRDSEGGPLLKRWTSNAFYRLFSYLSGVGLERGMADFRLLDRRVLDELRAFGEEGLFLRGIVQWVGYPSEIVEFECARRFRGRSKYTLWKMLKFAWRGVSSFSVVPLRMMILLGFFSSTIAFLSVVYAIVAKLWAGDAVPGWASTLAILSFLFGILFVFLGVLGEYLGRILIEVRRRPRYLVTESLGVPIRRDSVVPSRWQDER